MNIDFYLEPVKRFHEAAGTGMDEKALVDANRQYEAEREELELAFAYIHADATDESRKEVVKEACDAIVTACGIGRITNESAVISEQVMQSILDIEYILDLSEEDAEKLLEQNYIEVMRENMSKFAISRIEIRDCLEYFYNLNLKVKPNSCGELTAFIVDGDQELETVGGKMKLYEDGKIAKPMPILKKADIALELKND